MKIISLHTKSQLRLKKAIKGDRQAQEQIFNEFSPKMLGICRQYVKDIHHAEDLMLQGFLKVFENLQKFKNEGSFEGWIRRIMVNTCISYLRKKNQLELTDEEYQFNSMVTHNIESTSIEDIQKLIDNLPEGYKMVFNLYAIEGYKHSEIAEKLSISQSTSKSQLFKARKWLQANYIKMNRIKDAER
ncbi:sigma-70 family RNA polymerase sigma factor [uncultured Tenacibaculum sp.]|uniref:RNA polymerase sigma factor n=1 Tax=uncultured Tenacibaculum sp. TaxID=174713 RepID=UPI0026222F6E|nr:sigma-70 family RNA polymerase sigma factor [uncultured Tenacibaculum sp.]